VEIARRLRHEPTMTLKRIANRHSMVAWTQVFNCLGTGKAGKVSIVLTPIQIMEFVRPILFEQNGISLREAVVFDNGDLAFFGLLPAWMNSSIPGVMPSVSEIGSSPIEMATLYRHLRSALEEKKLADGYFPHEKAVKALVFKTPPRFELFWSETGHDVALYLNGEAWAFGQRQLLVTTDDN
jgi:hypothetical protein